MITTGSSLSSMMHVHDEPNFYPTVSSYTRVCNAKETRFSRIYALDN